MVKRRILVPLLIKKGTLKKTIATRGPFLESPDNFSGPKTCFMFVMFAFNIKVSNINHEASAKDGKRICRRT